MADLAKTKAELKAWERAFKAKNGREPKKDDIKLDPAIGTSSVALLPSAPTKPRTDSLYVYAARIPAEKYKVYSKSRKDAPAALSSSQRASAGFDKASSSSSSSSAFRPVPGRSSSPSRLVPSKDLSTTPSKLKSGRFSSSSTSVTHLSPIKRFPASNPFLVGGTPKKPSPLMPSDGPSAPKSPFSKAGLAGTPQKKSVGSPLYHSPLSPNKLAALISSHSTTGAPNDIAGLRAAADGWTPRTKARKRLNGELGSGNTPVKRRRGTGVVASREDERANQATPSSHSDPAALPPTVEEDADEVVIAPTPLKPSDQPRRALPVAQAGAGDEYESGSSSDEDMEGTASSAAAAKRKGKPGQSGRPRTLFTGGKSALIASKDSFASSPAQTSSLHPFFTSRTAQVVKPEPSSSSFSRAPTPAPDQTSTSTKDARPASPPTTSSLASHPLPTKKPRKPAAPSFGKINMTAAAKAKAEQAASRLQQEGGGSDADDDSADEVLSRVVQSHTLGKVGQRRTGRGLPQPVAGPQDDGMAGSDEEGMMQVDPDDEAAWNSELEEDLALDLRISPRKKKTNTLYGLPQEYSEEDVNSHTLVPDSDEEQEPDNDQDDGGRSTTRPRLLQPKVDIQDLPPHLLALLSLRSPQIASAKSAFKNESTFKAIFANFRPSEEEPPSTSLLAPSGRGGRGFKGKGKSLMAPPPVPGDIKPRATTGLPRKEKKVWGEVWGLGDVGGGGLDEIEQKDDEWDSEPEGWKEVGGDDEDW